MPIKIIADTRELLIDIFFAIIIAVGLENFVQHFIITNVFSELRPADLFQMTNFFLSPEVLIDALFFFASYFWVISHWVFYHELIEKYPYYNWWKFFVDISLFSIMFLIVNISYSVYTNEHNGPQIFNVSYSVHTNEHNDPKINYAIASLFVLLLIIWYSLSCLWHLSDMKLRPVRRYLIRHMKRIGTYLVLLALLFIPEPTSHTYPSYHDVVMYGVLLAMIGWNIYRLIRFLRKDLREYKLFHIFGIEASVSGSGILHLERFPMRKISKRRADKKHEDIIKLIIDHKEPIKIWPEKITSLKIEESRGDLTIDITYEEGSIKRVIGLDLDDRTIKGVFKELNQLHMKNKRKVN